MSIRKIVDERKRINAEIWAQSKKRSPEDEPKFAFVNAYVKLFGTADEHLSIKEIPEDKAREVLKLLKEMPVPKMIVPAAAEKMSDSQHRAIMAIVFRKFGRDYKGIFAFLKKEKNCEPVIKRMNPADVKNNYFPAFMAELSRDEANKIIRRFDAMKKGASKKNEQRGI